MSRVTIIELGVIGKTASILPKKKNNNNNNKQATRVINLPSAHIADTETPSVILLPTLGGFVPPLADSLHDNAGNRQDRIKLSLMFRIAFCSCRHEDFKDQISERRLLYTNRFYSCLM